MAWHRLLLAVAMAALVCSSATSAAEPASAKDVFPGKTWSRKTPADLGLQEGLLKEMARVAGGQGCVVRHGHLVFTWGDASRRRDVASACKPFFTHFLLAALADRRIPSLDEKIIRYQPGLKDLNKALDYKDRDITWRHVANQISCYGLREKPGSAFAYNDWQMALFWDTLFLKVYRTTYQDVDAKVARPMLFDAIGCEDKPTLMAFGPKNRPGRVAISPRDFARFGLLYLHQGRWRDKQLIPAKLARMAVTSPLPATLPRAGKKAADMMKGQWSLGSRSIPDNQCDHLGSYSWLWWINGQDAAGKRHWPDAPTDAYGAFGHGGIRAMVVLGSLDLIVSWNDTKVRGAEKENRVLGLLTRAAGGKGGK